ncbi:Flagellar basal body-associated protein FliL [Tindallia magadiensis]|uniref:Flagellar basal body-associated protein FliL n=1 Tax=Tindallia magadiensis TaxID=69895 RepID=A0A1I3FZR6_9FIRM|nr:hypothetical protein [Tindallia magadiensis]SFI16715.1 Flagellar basal body-associated protein FliL [Tindallia magadiensis]
MKRTNTKQKKKEIALILFLFFIAIFAALTTFYIVYTLDDSSRETRETISPYTVPVEVLTQAARTEDGGRRAYVKMTVVLELETRNDMREINRYSERSKAIISQTINSIPAESMLDAHGLNVLQNKLIENLQSELSITPINIYYDEMIVQ